MFAEKSARKGAAAEHSGWLQKKGGINPAPKQRYCVLRGGALQTPWGQGKWGVRRQDEQAAPGQVFADFLFRLQV